MAPVTAALRANERQAQRGPADGGLSGRASCCAPLRARSSYDRFDLTRVSGVWFRRRFCTSGTSPTSTLTTWSKPVVFR